MQSIRLQSSLCTDFVSLCSVYLAVDCWGFVDPVLLEPAYEAIGRARNAPGLVIDVRMNGGGDETLAQQIAGCFVTEPVLYATHVFVTENGGFTEPGQRWLQPNDGRPSFSGRVAVLTGPAVMSSNEAFLLMMRQADNARLIGAPSQGSSGNPRRRELPNGVRVYLPSWISMTPEGEGFEGEGLQPDIEVETSVESFVHSDPVLDAAMEWVGSGG